MATSEAEIPAGSTPSPPSSVVTRTFLGEFCTLPYVSTVCDKVSSSHARVSGVVPLYAWLVAAGLAGAATLGRTLTTWGGLTEPVGRLDKAGIWTLDTVRGRNQSPKDLAKQVLVSVWQGVARVAGWAGSRVVCSPVARLPMRVALAVTGKATDLLDSLRLDDFQSVAKLQGIYNRALTTLTERLRSCHDVVEKVLQASQGDGAISKSAIVRTKRKRSNQESQATDSSSDTGDEAKSTTGSGDEETTAVHTTENNVHEGASGK